MDLELDGQTLSQLTLIDHLMGLILNIISEPPQRPVNKSLQLGFQNTEKLMETININVSNTLLAPNELVASLS